MAKEQFKTVRVLPPDAAHQFNTMYSDGYGLVNSFLIDNKIFGIFELRADRRKPKPKKATPKKKA